jgi:hypothetical protein
MDIHSGAAPVIFQHKKNRNNQLYFTAFFFISGKRAAKKKKNKRKAKHLKCDVLRFFTFSIFTFLILLSQFLSNPKKKKLTKVALQKIYYYSKVGLQHGRSWTFIV